MDYKKEIGRRIRQARGEKAWTLDELSRRTGDVLGIKRISHYETGLRMPGPSEAVILAKALGKKAAWIMAVDDAQIPINSLEETLVKNWRTLAERDRMELFRRVETLAMASRDPVPDSRVEHMSAKGKAVPKAVAKRRVKLRSEGEKGDPAHE